MCSHRHFMFNTLAIGCPSPWWDGCKFPWHGHLLRLTVGLDGLVVDHHCPCMVMVQTTGYCCPCCCSLHPAVPCNEEQPSPRSNSRQQQQQQQQQRRRRRRRWLQLRWWRRRRRRRRRWWWRWWQQSISRAICTSCVRRWVVLILVRQRRWQRQRQRQWRRRRKRFRWRRWCTRACEQASKQRRCPSTILVLECIVLGAAAFILAAHSMERQAPPVFFR